MYATLYRASRRTVGLTPNRPSRHAVFPERQRHQNRNPTSYMDCNSSATPAVSQVVENKRGDEWRVRHSLKICRRQFWHLQVIGGDGRTGGLVPASDQSIVRSRSPGSVTRNVRTRRIDYQSTETVRNCAYPRSENRGLRSAIDRCVGRNGG